MTVSSLAADPVASHLEKTLGLSFSGPRRARLLATIEAERLASRLEPDAFRAAVARPGPVFDRLVTQITVGETYFFRDRQQCELLRTEVFGTLSATTPPGRGIAVWSAGCASGEETYTLAALADDAGLGDRCSIVGSDVCRTSLDKAVAGMYGRWSMRSVTEAEKAAHFRTQGGRFLVSERLRRRTVFTQRNLLDGPPPPGRFDVVLCRNLLIYLTRESVQRAAHVLAGSLAPDGWLITAAGDPPLVAPGLARVRTPFGLAYRRTAAASTRALATAEPQPERTAAGRSTAHRRRASRLDRPAAAAAATAPPEPVRPPATPTTPGAAQEAVDAVRSLGDVGRLEEACAAAQAALDLHPLHVELRYLAGVLLLEAGRVQEASAAATAAVYLQPDSPAAHLLLGQAQHAAGDLERARRSFRNAVRLLAVTPAEAPVALAPGVPASHLATVAQHYLSAIMPPA